MNNKIHKIPVVAGICIALSGIIPFIVGMIQCIRYHYYWLNILLFFLVVIAPVCFLVALIKHNRIILFVAFGLDIAYYIYSICISDYIGNYIPSIIIRCSAVVFFFLLVWLSDKKKSAVKYLWFFSPILYLVSLIFHYRFKWLLWDLRITYSGNISFFSYYIYDIIKDILFITGVFLVALCIRKNIFIRMIKKEKATDLSAATQQRTSSAERIKQLKELLDAGIITQDEFDEKKETILETETNSNSELLTNRSTDNNKPQQKPVYKQKWFIAIIIAVIVGATIILYDVCTVSQEEALKAAEKSRRAYQQSMDEVRALEDRIAEIDRLIDYYKGN